MNIGIITFHRAENYGSALQAYALNYFLRSSYAGSCIETIDYQNKAQHDIYRNFQPVRSFMGLMRNIHTLCTFLPLKKRKERFRRFIDEDLVLSEFHGENKDDLACYARKYDYLICGSDQIWNVRCWDYDECYMLSFAEKSHKIAYAPSLGLNAFCASEETLFRKYLSTFDALSVREEQGAAYLSNILHREMETVADPVFLLSADSWRSIAAKPELKGKYILCYFIGNISGMRNFAKKVQRESGIDQVVVIIKNLRDLFSGYTSKFATGPKEFLGLIDGAEYIITDSFHAVAFSLLFHKRFWVFVESGANAASKPNSRINNILGIAELKDRILDATKCSECNYAASIDFTQSDVALKRYIDDSVRFLKKHIEKI